MNTVTQSPLLAFTQEIYRQKAVMPALSKLQNDFNLNPNIVLYCCWCGESGRGKLYQKQLKQLIARSHDWHEQIVCQFNSKQASQPTHPLPPWLYQARQALQEEAQTAEQIEQRMLCDVLMKPVNSKRTTLVKLQDACHNLATYCKVSGVTLTTSGCRAAQQILMATFPNLSRNDIEKRCYTALGQPGAEKYPYQQRSLI